MEMSNVPQMILISALWIFNAAILFVLNQRVKAASRKSSSMLVVKVSNYGLMLGLWSLEICLDTWYPPTPTALGLAVITFKSFTASFTLALLDYHFSHVDYVSFGVIPGAIIWSICYSVNTWLLVNVFGGINRMEILKIFDFADASRILFEFGRFVVFFVPLGFFTDLAFSPLHRFVHSSLWIYKKLHARHHSFRAQLTSLVIYHAEALDDLLMAACPIVGFAATMLFFRGFGQIFPALMPSGDFTISNAIWYFLCQDLAIPGARSPMLFLIRVALCDCHLPCMPLAGIFFI
jgi:hypothetical protein